MAEFNNYLYQHTYLESGGTYTVTVYFSPANPIQVLDVLDGGEGLIADLSIPLSPLLLNLDIANNYNLTSINLGNAPNLEVLYAYQTGVTSLDATGLSSLSTVDVRSCQNLTSFTGLSGNTNLSNLYVSGSSLTDLDVSGCTNLYLGGEFPVDNCNYLTSLNVSGCTGLTTLESSGCGSLVSLGIDDLSITLTSLYLQAASSLPSLDVSGLTALTILVVTDCGSLITLTLGDALTALSNLTASYNSLTSLDVSGCTGLIGLDVDNCPSLSTLTLGSNLGNLSFLYTYTCSSLTSLDVSGCGVLENLQTYNSGLLATINLGGLNTLGQVYAAGCSLTSLDITDCNHLNYLDLNSNALTGDSVDAILTQLVAIGTTNSYTWLNGGFVDLSGGNNAAPSCDVGVPNLNTLLANGVSVTVTSYSC